ncbi:MAG: ATP-binding protein [Victivallales bacterium]|nr:ATP-binding protein [Victivallales bacterium]
MEEKNVQRLYEISRRLVVDVPMSFRRYLQPKINWANRLVCIRGAKGTGKTTLLLQHLREALSQNDDKALFVSLDNIWFAAHDVMDLADWHWKHGGTHLFLDEVHHLRNWQTIIKNLYDTYPSLNIVYTGSSMLRLEAGSGDLSRRRVPYTLPVLSFREYLKFEGILEVEPVALVDILKKHRSLAFDICGKVRVLEHFLRYLRHGCYPFYKEGVEEYDIRLREIVNQILEIDYPTIDEVSVATTMKAKKMLAVLAESVPQTPRMAQLYRELETDRNQGLKILKALMRAGLLQLLSSEKAALKDLSRPDKIYLENTNLMHVLSLEVDKGCSRETFMLNQLRAAGHEVTYPPQGDFLVDGRWLFEVGGAGKKFTQIKDIPDSFIAVDDIEFGIGNKIPLWLFGFLY